MINELQLQIFWLNRAKSFCGLKTLCGQDLKILHQGIFNTNQGPDFSFSRIKIGEVEWVGNIELHLRTSDWFKHHHQEDKNYNNVILHVVWKNDIPYFGLSPILELCNYVDENEILHLGHFSSYSLLVCEKEGSIPLDAIVLEEIQALGFKRVENKKEQVLHLFDVHKNDFSKVLWQLVFRSFGRVQNAHAFESLFASIPIHVLRLYAYEQFKLESILFGQAGLIPDDATDAYPKKLLENYSQVQEKFGLVPLQEKIFFLRMRPRNFPTIRIAQLAAFYHQNMGLVTQLLRLSSLKELEVLFDVKHGGYWENHFVFDRISSPRQKLLGLDFIHQTILNAFVPFLIAYGQVQGNQKLVEKAIDWLHTLPPENNAITQVFTKIGFRSASVLDTQGMVEIYHTLCLNKQCALCCRGRLINRLPITS
jgi:hypothetical protein